MQTIPAIDLLGDAAVRLTEGDYDSVSVTRDLAEHLAEVVARRPPMIHVVDLDGARSGAIRFDLVSRIIAEAGIPVQVSGGVRDIASARRLLDAGAARVV